MKRIECRAQCNGLELTVDCKTRSSGKRLIEALVAMLLATSSPNKLSDLNKLSESISVGYVALDKGKLIVDVPFYAVSHGIPQSFAQRVEIDINVKCGSLAPPNKAKLLQALKYAGALLPEIFLEDEIYGEECKYKAYGRLKSVIDDAVKYVGLSGFSLTVG